MHNALNLIKTKLKVKQMTIHIPIYPINIFRLRQQPYHLRPDTQVGQNLYVFGGLCVCVGGGLCVCVCLFIGKILQYEVLIKISLIQKDGIKAYGQLDY